MIDILLGIIHPINILSINVGIAFGVIIGSLPGLNVVFAIAVLLPFTFSMDSITSMYLLLGTYCGGTFGGSMSAILINTPGTPSAIATVMDGYPLAQKGKPGDALRTALIASFVGGILSCVALMFFAPQIARFATKLGAAEYFALCIFGMSAAIGIAGNKPVKGIIMAVFGLLVSTVGIDATEGTQRFMFGNMHLLAGIAPMVVMLGVFALAEVLDKSILLVRNQIGNDNIIVYSKPEIKIREILSKWKNLLRSSLIGIGVGALPGTGGGIAAMLAYNEARRSSKNHEEFGNGSIDGIVAPESANNATTGATLIPLLTLGIPGDAAVAVLLGALTMQGIIPGPSLFAQGGVWVYTVIGGLFVINIFMLLQGSLFVRLASNLLRAPLVLLVPCITVLCIVGAFSLANSSFDVLLMVVFGIVGYFLRKNAFPVPPLVIALVLGTFMESNLRRSLILSQGSFSIFITRPISAIIILLSVLSLAYPLLRARFFKPRVNG